MPWQFEVEPGKWLVFQEQQQIDISSAVDAGLTAATVQLGKDPWLLNFEEGWTERLDSPDKRYILAHNAEWDGSMNFEDVDGLEPSGSDNIPPPGYDEQSEHPGEPGSSEQIKVQQVCNAIVSLCLACV